ncbi:hypothetical protein BDV96DRAFT_1001 [Lophiotrema nucula]|uniref:Uncharacterized protein n=1 Tax=Lophiotrema nucula TaxID=690887 RepID=A0A6A5ZUF9_9PLEO|nr:hypothetical protein BDV96DRAFT_1001 [Lophiotrema nucula]
MMKCCITTSSDWKSKYAYEGSDVCVHSSRVIRRVRGMQERPVPRASLILLLSSSHENILCSPMRILRDSSLQILRSGSSISSAIENCESGCRRTQPLQTAYLVLALKLAIATSAGSRQLNPRSSRHNLSSLSFCHRFLNCHACKLFSDYNEELG